MRKEPTTAQKLKEIRERAGFSMKRLATSIGYKDASSYQRYEDDGGYKRRAYLATEVAEKIAQAVVGSGDPPISRAEVMALAGVRPPELEVDIHRHKNSKEVVVSSPQQGLTFEPREDPLRAGNRNLPILGHVKAGSLGLFIDQGERQAVTMRPDFLEGNAQAYAVRVHDTSMSPAFEPGYVVYVDPTRPPLPGNDVVIQMHDGEAFIKRLRRRTERAIFCEQFNPAGQVEYKPSKVRSIHLVVLISPFER